MNAVVLILGIALLAIAYDDRATGAWRDRPMIVSLILAAASRCAVSTLCPTDEQLISAVRNRDYAFAESVIKNSARYDPDNITMINTQPIRRISRIVCSDALPNESPGNPTTINCAFVIRYWTRDSHTVAKLIYEDGIWEIRDSLSVTRDRR